MEFNSSLTSVEKLMFNSSNKNENIYKGKIVKSETGEIGLILLKNKTSKYKIESIQLLEGDKEEEFLDGSDIFTNNDLNSTNNLPVEEVEKNIRKSQKKKNSICLFIDNLVNANNELKNYKKYSSMSYSDLENKEFDGKLYVEDKIIKFNEDDIQKFFNMIDKKLLLETNCSICYNQFQINDEISLIKSCLHIFHFTCLNQWIGVKDLNKNTCPYCKGKIDPNLD